MRGGVTAGDFRLLLGGSISATTITKLSCHFIRSAARRRLLRHAARRLAGLRSLLQVEEEDEDEDEEEDEAEDEPLELSSISHLALLTHLELSGSMPPSAGRYPVSLDPTRVTNFQ